MNPLTIKDIYILIANYMENAQQLLSLQISKLHLQIIKNGYWDNFCVCLNKRIFDYVMDNYHFLDVTTNFINITTDEIKKLQKCRFVNLNYTRIKDQDIKLLKNCHTLHLSHTEITDETVKLLKDCHTLDLNVTRISDIGAMELKNCHKLYIYDTEVTNECIKMLQNNGVIIVMH